MSFNIFWAAIADRVGWQVRLWGPLLHRSSSHQQSPDNGHWQLRPPARQQRGRNPEEFPHHRHHPHHLGDHQHLVLCPLLLRLPPPSGQQIHPPRPETQAGSFSLMKISMILCSGPQCPRIAWSKIHYCSLSLNSLWPPPTYDCL